ncbi:FtsL-like putative cell division protein [Tenuifilum osseticum]|uniref:FtsL-like putative cell division protein n=1 Tax=Tenuifilum osseticum TaxID=3374723 RepID=UPI0034E4B534
MTEQNTPEFDDVKPTQQPEDKKGKKVGAKDFISGRILTHEMVSGQMPYIIFLVVLAIIYIANNYHYNNLLRTELKLRKEVKNLRAESITTAAQYMSISRQSEVVKLVEEKGLGLIESRVPPKKLK